MKFLLVLLGLIAVAASDFVANTKEDLVKYRTECAHDLEIPESVMAEYVQWHFGDDDLTKKYIHCIFVKMHLYQDGHGPLVDNLVVQLSHHTTDDIRSEVLKCADEEHKDNDILRAWNGFVCYKKHNLHLIRHSIGLEE